MRGWSFLLALAPVLAVANSASAQTMFGGYDIGPDYGAAFDYHMQQSQQLGAQIDAMEHRIVGGNMADPQIQRMFFQYQSEGGQMSFEQYAYMFGATGGFSESGIAQFNRVTEENAAKEHEAYLGLLEAQRQTTAAYGELYEHRTATSNEFGNVLGGNATYVDGRTGTEHVLSYMQPGVPTYDAATGQTYVMDQQGRYQVLGLDGYWYPMAPRY